jgi:hypothetical protein
MEAGIADVWKTDFPLLMDKLNTGKLSSGDLFGTREYLKNNYDYRFLGGKLGVYGNSREEALYPSYFIDSKGEKLDAANANYELKFQKGQLPPAGAFWSFTMYDGKSQLLVENPLNRYLINSTMLNSLKYGKDGSLTIYISNKNPGSDKVSNWLPSPSGPFYAMMRIYIPRPEVFDGRWTRPEIVKTYQ